MKIAVVGGGASGMVTAYLLDKQGHHVTVFEKQLILGGHIRTLNQNVQPNRSDCDQPLEGGVLEFPRVFHNFLHLMEELEVELEPVDLGSALYLSDGRAFLSSSVIRKNFKGIRRLVEYLRLDTLYARSTGFWISTKFHSQETFAHQPLVHYLTRPCIRNCWLKLLTMYSYSMPFALIDQFPAELAIPALRDYVFVDWVRIKGGVYSYIEKILHRFTGNLLLNVEITAISRTPDAVKIECDHQEAQNFDRIVFATPPDQVMALLADPTEAESRRFLDWKANRIKTIMHTDTSMYARYGIQQGSEFDFFETKTGWGYNAYLNQLCGIASPQSYSLAFELDGLIATDKILHIQEHHTPLYTVESFQYRDEIINTNGENHTYHVGAYLGDGLHEGAIASAMRVAQLIG